MSEFKNLQKVEVAMLRGAPISECILKRKPIPNFFLDLITVLFLQSYGLKVFLEKVQIILKTKYKSCFISTD